MSLKTMFDRGRVDAVNAGGGFGEPSGVYTHDRLWDATAPNTEQAFTAGRVSAVSQNTCTSKRAGAGETRNVDRGYVPPDLEDVGGRGNYHYAKRNE